MIEPGNESCHAAVFFNFSPCENKNIINYTGKGVKVQLARGTSKPKTGSEYMSCVGIGNT